MTWSLTSPITGTAQTGLTSPTYTLTADTASDVNGKQSVVSALGGTQTGVVAHSIACPFTIAAYRPKIFKILGKTNPVTGLLPSVPVNTFSVTTVKGVLPLAGQPHARLKIKTIIEAPAGADAADPNSVRAALSAHIGALSQQSAGLGDTVVSGVL
jgi:hypothetical protein